MTLTIKPDLPDGHCALQDDDGNVVGLVVARASDTIPGYVTLISDQPLGHAIRIPAEWARELERVRDVRVD